jgi:hypothetical protein
VCGVRQSCELLLRRSWEELHDRPFTAKFSKPIMEPAFKLVAVLALWLSLWLETRFLDAINFEILSV